MYINAENAASASAINKKISRLRYSSCIEQSFVICCKMQWLCGLTTVVLCVCKKKSAHIQGGTFSPSECLFLSKFMPNINNRWVTHVEAVISECWKNWTSDGRRVPGRREAAWRRTAVVPRTAGRVVRLWWPALRGQEPGQPWLQWSQWETDETRRSVDCCRRKSLVHRTTSRTVC